MKLLVTGTTGFIGGHLLKRLQAENHSVVALVRPTTNIEALKNQRISFHIFDTDITELTNYMIQEKFDGVIHLASLFLAQHKPEDIKNLIESNVFFGTAVLEASAKSNTPWFINTGTFWQHYKNKRYDPVNLYAATKQAFEDIAAYYTATTKLSCVTIKLNDTFGPNDTRPKVFNLWRKVSASGETLDMSPGEQLMDISYIGNVIDGFMKMIELLAQNPEKFRNASFAISASKRMSLKKLAQLFEKVTGTKLSINWGKKPYRPREVMIPWTKGKKIPGWKAKVSLEEGIKRTFNE